MYINAHRDLSRGIICFWLTVMDTITKEIQGEATWCMMFACDIILIGRNLEKGNNKLKGKESKG